MAIRIDINETVLRAAIKQAIQSNNRAIASARYPAMKPIYEDQTKHLEHALTSISTVK